MKTLEELIADKPDGVKIAVRNAILAAKKRNTVFDYKETISHGIMHVALASSLDVRFRFAVLVLGEVLALVEYLHNQKVEKSRREGTAAGLAAYEESLRAGPGKKDSES